MSATIVGLTTIKWGTANVLSSPVTTLIEVIDCTPNIDGPVDRVKNTDGARVSLALLDDGFSATVRAKYDGALSYPAVGTNVTVNQVANASTITYNCVVTSKPVVSFKEAGAATISWKIETLPTAS